MELSPLRCTVLFAVTCALVAVQSPAQQITFTDEVFPGAFQPGQGPAVMRLVDDLTGAPIGGAEVFLVPEHETPIAGEFWSSSSAVSDADGFVRVPRNEGDRGAWQVLKHPQRGVAMRSGAVRPIWRVGRTFDVPLEVQDWLGRPAAGARVGFCGGCGHTPDLVVAVADANGAAVLRGIDPWQGIRDLYVQHPGLHFYYDSVDWRPGEPPMVVRCGYGPVQTGKVVDHTGKPVAGAFVCGGAKHRGPWARTAADGSFTVLGAADDDSPHRVVTPEGRDVYFHVRGANPYPVTLRLPDLAGTDAYEGAVDVASAAEAQPVATRSVRVLVEGAPAARMELSVWYPGCPEDTAAGEDRVDVPVDAPFLLTVSEPGTDWHGDREYHFADAGAVGDQLVVKWRPTTRVLGRVVDAAGRPVAAVVRWFDSDAKDGAGAAADEGRFDVAADRERGWRLLEILPANGAPPRRSWVLVPGYGGRVELGAVVVGGAPQLTVLDTDGAPLPTARAAYARPGWQEADGFQRWPLADDATWLGPDLREGDTILVQRDEHAVEFRATLAGAGPWRIAPPDGRLELQVVGDDGVALAATVVFADQEATTEDGSLALHGLPNGALRLYVSAPGHRSAIVDTEVTPAGRTLQVSLPVK